MHQYILLKSYIFCSQSSRNRSLRFFSKKMNSWCHLEAGVPFEKLLQKPDTRLSQTNCFSGHFQRKTPPTHFLSELTDNFISYIIPRGRQQHLSHCEERNLQGFEKEQHSSFKLSKGTRIQNEVIFTFQWQYNILELEHAWAQATGPGQN